MPFVSTAVWFNQRLIYTYLATELVSRVKLVQYKTNAIESMQPNAVEKNCVRIKIFATCGIFGQLLLDTKRSDKIGQGRR